MVVIIIKERVNCVLVVGRIRSDEFPKQDMNTENQVYKISVYLIIRHSSWHRHKSESI